MRLLLFDDHKLGVWDGQQVLDASAAVADRGHHSPQEMMEMVIGDWANAESAHPRRDRRCRTRHRIGGRARAGRRFPGRASWSAWPGTTWNPRSRREACSTPFSSRPTRRSATVGRSYCPMPRRVSSTSSRSWRWSSASAPAALRPRMRWTTSSATRSSSTCRPGGCPAASSWASRGTRLRRWAPCW